ncbi:MAG: hypothetical protein JNK05_29185 [Myxococcales bacterium]|nr:hypothetical protein [Myxococcales bacterium]
MLVVRCSREVVCARCDRPLEVGSWVIEQGSYYTAQDPSSDWFHLPCAIDVSSYWAKIALDVCNEPVEQLDALRTLATERELARQAAIRPGAVVPAIEPAKDPFGRPRVTALFVGSAFNQRSWDQFTARLRYRTWRSSVREYVFAWIGSLERWRDPSRPVTAGVFAVDVTKKVVKAQLDRLRELYEMGVSSPVLWLIGGATSDDGAAYFREQLARAGFDGDEATVLAGPAAIDGNTQYDASALDPLCEALDRCSVVRPRKA